MRLPVAVAPAEPTAAQQTSDLSGRLLRSHWPALVLLAFGLTLRLMALVAYRPALFYTDTPRYLSNQAFGMDPLGYKAPLVAIGSIGGFGAVVAVQHLLGLAMAVLIYVLLLRRGAGRWLGALAIAPRRLDAYQVQIEQVLMPDVWFEALIVVGLAILLWQRPTRGGDPPQPPAGPTRGGDPLQPPAGPTRGGDPPQPPAGPTRGGDPLQLPAGPTRGGDPPQLPAGAPGWRRVVAAGLVLGTSATVAQVGEALLLPAVIYVLAASGGGWRLAVGKAAALGAAFALPILAYCTGSYLLTGSFFLSHTGVTSLYGRTAAAADCAALRLPPAERGMCPSPAQQAQGPDWLEYFGPVQRYYRTLPRAEVNSLITDFSKHVLSQQPLRVAGAYGRDVVTLFTLSRAGSQGNTPISRWQFQVSYPYYQHVGPRYVASQIGGTPAIWLPGARFLRTYQLDGGYTPGPLFALFAVAGLVGSIGTVRRRAAPALACLLFFTSAVSVLTVSDLFEFSWRYQLPALVTLAPAGALGIRVIVETYRRYTAAKSP